MPFLLAKNAMAKFYLVVGSVMGTAERIAEHIAAQLKQNGHNVFIDQHYQAGNLAMHIDSTLLICTSTTGMGDLPANIQPLYNELQNSPPNVYGKAYGLICLGDSSYENFARAGFDIHHALQDLGALCLEDSLILDAGSDEDPLQQSQDWLSHWLIKHEQYFAQ